MVLVLVVILRDWDKAAFYALSPDECQQLAPHAARLAPKIEDNLHVPKWVHDAIVTSDDTVALISLAIGYLSRIGVLDKVVPQIVKAFTPPRREQHEQSTSNTSKVSPEQNGHATGQFSKPGGGVVAYNPSRVDITKVPGIGAQYTDS